MERPFCGLAEVGVVYSEDTPLEIAQPTGTTVVPVQRVVEAESPALDERSHANK